jgi:hypothetical protein
VGQPAASDLLLAPGLSVTTDARRRWYIGLRGEGTKNQRKVVANAVYEAVPNVKDHRLPSQDGAPAMLL